MSRNISAKVEYTGPIGSCFALTSWPLASSGVGQNDTIVLRVEAANDQVKYLSVLQGGSGSLDSSGDVSAEKKLRINGKFGKCLELEEQEPLFISRMEGRVLVVKSAFVTCLSEDDWEILEENPEDLRNKLLNQLRVVYPGLTFPFWISKTMMINLKIEKLDPPCEFGLLEEDTEIIIPSKGSSRLQLKLEDELELRIHPITLSSDIKSLCPSTTLLLDNIHHGFLHYDRNYFKMKGIEIDIGHFTARLISINFSNTLPNSGIPLKIFLLVPNLFEEDLQSRFPKTNPPCIFLHPQLIRNHPELRSKSYVRVIQVPENEFDSIELVTSPILNENADVSLNLSSPFQSLISQGTTFLTGSLSLHPSSANYSDLLSGNLLITGKDGSGKTTLALSMAKQLSNFPFFVHYELISCAKLRGKKPENLEKELQGIFEKALAQRPSIIILDDFDVICPLARTDQQNLPEEFFHFRIAETLSEMIYPIERRQITLICTARPDCLNSYWRTRNGFHFFKSTLSIPPPNKEERIRIFRESTLRYQGPAKPIRGKKSTPFGTNNTQPEWTDNELTERVKSALSALHPDLATPQFLHNVAKRWVLFRSISKETGGAEEEPDINAIIREELVDGEHKSGDDTKKVLWEDIGGMSGVKTDLDKILKWPLQYPQLFANCPIKMPSGILLYGYPGCGKTLLGLAIPSFLNTKFIHIKGPELLSKYIGASEQAVQDLFRRARNSRPCILFLDEFDSIVSRRGHDSTGVTDRVTNQFLAELDGIEGGLREGVYIVASTSRPDLIDPAILRPGRLDKHLFFDLPTKEERVEILQKMSKDLDFEEGVDWGVVGSWTEGFTGADLHSLLFSTHLASVKAYLGFSTPAKEEQTDGVRIPISRQTLEETLANFKPSLPAHELLRFKNIYTEFQGETSSGEEEKGPGKVVIEREKKATLA